MDWSSFRCNTPYRTDNLSLIYIRLQWIGKFSPSISLSNRVYQFIPLTFVASNLWITGPSRRACASWMVLNYMTFGIVCAWIALSARILAQFIDAGFCRCAFTVASTIGLRNNRVNETIGKWIASITGRTRAYGPMIFHPAFGRTGTWITICTWINAISILTRFQEAAIVIFRAASVLKRLYKLTNESSVSLFRLTPVACIAIS